MPRDYARQANVVHLERDGEFDAIAARVQTALDDLPLTLNAPVFSAQSVNDASAVDTLAATLSQAQGAVMVLTGTASGKFKGNQVGSITSVLVAASLASDANTTLQIEVESSRVGFATRRDTFNIPVGSSASQVSEGATYDPSAGFGPA